MGHPEWKKAEIKIFAMFPEEELADTMKELVNLIQVGRLPISRNNVELIALKPEISKKEIICRKSKDADLTILGFRGEHLKQNDIDWFRGYDEIGNVLFVNASSQKEIALD